VTAELDRIGMADRDTATCVPGPSNRRIFEHCWSFFRIYQEALVDFTRRDD
jgi:hypothetical protein